MNERQTGCLSFFYFSVMEEPASQFALIFSLATVAMLVLAGFIILFVVYYQKRMVQEQLKRQQLEMDFQQKMMEAMLESEENERRRIAGDLHDSVGGMLSAIRMGLSAIGKKLPDPAMVEQQKQMLDETITSVRRISLDLMPSTLEKFGLVPALREICERFAATAGVPVDYRVHHEEAYALNDRNKEVKIFRIVQELMNNAIKHAQASSISVVVDAGESLKVTVEDDGVGFDPVAKRAAGSGAGLGLFNMENRARLLNGRIDFQTETQKGSKITLIVPYEATESLHRG